MVKENMKTVASGMWTTIVYPISLLVHSRHQKSMSFILYKRVIYTYTIVQHRNREGKASLGFGGRREGSLRRRRRRRRRWRRWRRRWTATHSQKFLIFQNMQSTIKRCNIDHKCFGTCFSHWHQSKKNKKRKRKRKKENWGKQSGWLAGINFKLFYEK